MKKQKILHWIMAVLIMIGISIFSGCASSIMTQVPPVEGPYTQHAVVTFLRPSMFGGAIQFGLWDGENFVGILSAKKYIQYLAEPGEHVFLGRAENWSYVKADLEGGKNYYILGRVFPGVWKARVAFDPITKDDGTTNEQIEKWMKSLTPTGVLPEKRESYMTPRMKQIKQAIDNFHSGKVKFEVLEADDDR